MRRNVTTMKWGTTLSHTLVILLIILLMINQLMIKLLTKDKGSFKLRFQKLHVT